MLHLGQGHASCLDAAAQQLTPSGRSCSARSAGSGGFGGSGFVACFRTIVNPLTAKQGSRRCAAKPKLCTLCHKVNARRLITMQLPRLLLPALGAAALAIAFAPTAVAQTGTPGLRASVMPPRTSRSPFDQRTARSTTSTSRRCTSRSRPDSPCRSRSPTTPASSIPSRLQARRQRSHPPCPRQHADANDGHVHATLLRHLQLDVQAVPRQDDQNGAAMRGKIFAIVRPDSTTSPPRGGRIPWPGHPTRPHPSSCRVWPTASVPWTLQRAPSWACSARSAAAVGVERGEARRSASLPYNSNEQTTAAGGTRGSICPGYRLPGREH